MSKKVAFQNTTDRIIYKGGIAIRPNDTRLVDAQYVTAPIAEFNGDDFLSKNIPDIKSSVAELTDEQLHAVLQSESEGKKRKSLIQLFLDEQESRHFIQATQIVTEELRALDISELQQRLLAPENSDEDNALIQSVLDVRLAEQPAAETV